MERRSRLLTFVFALIPGAGQMYLGLIKRGIQLLALYILLKPVLGIIGLGSIGSILKVIIWCYAFFDTFEIARRLDRGEKVSDSDYVINKYFDKNLSEASNYKFPGNPLNKSFWLLCGWGLVVIGILAIINLAFGSNDLYWLIKSYISTYFIPVLLVIAGLYMLVKNKK